MKYLLIVLLGIYIFFDLSIWEIFGLMFAAGFFSVGVVGLCYRDQSAAYEDEEKHTLGSP